MQRNTVHFVGIGGIGVSALASWFLKNGWNVSGSDLERSDITDKLGKEGATIKIGKHRAENLPAESKLLIHTAAANKNPEIAAAKSKNIKIQTYAEALGGITAQYMTIAVAGSHGKSTTAALIALILTSAGLDPTVFIGTKLREFTDPIYWLDAWLSPKNRSMGSNFRKGSSPFIVLEADEWGGSFFNYTPSIAVITNIDKEHLDFYKTEQNVRRAFRKFILRLKREGKIVANADDPAVKNLASELATTHRRRFANQIHFYSLADRESNAVKAALRLRGLHNASNAMAAFTVARILNIPEEVTLKVLSEFEGAWRRFEEIGSIRNAPVIADYAHHPTEIQATIKAAQAHFGQKKIIAIFQPHQYERTVSLFREFQNAFIGADVVCLIDIYEVAGRERKKTKDKTSSFHLARELSKVRQEVYYISYPSQIREFIVEQAGPFSVILMMGAGSIWNMGREMFSHDISKQVHVF